VALSAGWNHSCALDTVGHAYCWGQNNFGQLGDGTNIIRAVPTAVGGDLLFRAIAAGGSHTCALTTDDQTYCWGRNSAGQLGIDDNQPHTLPAHVGGPPTPFTTITAGGVHSCALTSAGDAYCWGRNSYGQVGDGTTLDRNTPVKVVGGLSFATIQANGAHTCATLSNGGTAYCWGNNSDGQVGDGTTVDRPEPVAAGAPR
jgi:alpha-tubulin suppressor-like RCC1 family protein